MLGEDRRVYDATFSNPPPEKVDFVIVLANGSGAPGRPRMYGTASMVEHLREHAFDVVYDNLPKQPLTLFGVRLTNSSYGFGPLVLQRRSTLRYW